MNRGAFAGIAAAAGIVSVLGDTAGAQDGPKIRMAAVPTETMAAPLYAREGGFFQKAGVNVDVQLFSSLGAANVAASGGAIDVCANDPLQLTNAIAHGLDFQYFAGGWQYVAEVPTTTLCVAKNGPIKSARDLEGQAIAVPEVRNLASLCVQEWMSRNGGDPTKAHFVELPGSAMAPAILHGTIAAAMVSEPSATQFAADLRMLANAYRVIGTRFQLNSYYARKDWIAANSELVRTLTAAIYDAARWSNSHHPDTLEVLAKYSKVDIGKLNGIKRATYATGLDFGLIKPVLDIGLKYKVIDKALPASDMIAKIA